MYLPGHFDERDPAQLQQIIQQYPFATLVVSQPSSSATQQLPWDVTAHHLPFHLQPTVGPLGTLQAHIARANPLWQEASDQAVLVIFRGAQHYISPNWYPSKAEQGKAVPTWNYIAVHAYGRLRITHDKAWLHSLLTQLTQTHETISANPWQVSDAPADYLDKMLENIVGLEIQIERILGKFKLSQNKTPADRAGVRAGLAEHAKHAQTDSDAHIMQHLIP